MPTALLEPLLAYLQSSPLALLGLMGILLLCGLGLPLPEDVVLISAGLLAAGNGHSWGHASVAMYAGVIAGDALAFGIGHRYGLRLLAIPWVGARVPPEKVQTIQRAGLLDAMLADLYGPQKLLRERRVPPMLVHGNRHFLRPCRVMDGTAPPSAACPPLSHSRLMRPPARRPPPRGTAAPRPRPCAPPPTRRRYG